ncbi:MAG: lysylphosphatidylglycerol synthase domain-containing protein [Acidimicrobiales bacterium]
MTTVAPVGAPSPSPPVRRRRRERAPSTLLWVMAKCLLAGALVAGVVTAFLAFSPMRNPNVQDCGTPLGFVVFNRTDVPVDVGAPGAPPDARALADQPTCRERVIPRLQQTLIAFAAFLGLALVGAVLGLLDDRLAYHRAPRFESLLRERPSGAPNLLRPPPALDTRDVGSRLPPVELLDVVVPVALFAIAAAGLVVFAGTDEVRAAFDDRGSGLGVLAVLALVALAFVVAGAQLVVSHRRPIPVGTAVMANVAGAWLGRVLPALGPLGLDAHVLVRRGVERHEAITEQQARQWLGVLAHVVVLVPVAVVGLGVVTSRPSWPDLWWVPALWSALVVLVGLTRAADRWRRLVVRPDRRGLAALGRLLGDPVRAVAGASAALALTLVHTFAFVVTVGWAGGGLDFAPLALVFLGAVTAALVAPSPSGVGLFEPLAVLGLVWAGMAVAPAVVAVLAYRLLALWAPMPVGALAARLLRRSGTV